MTERLRFVLVAAFALISFRAFAQTTNGAVTGIVTDSTGAGIPKARITLTDRGTGSKRDATSDSAGGFRVNGVPEGNYRVEVQANGFKTGTADFKLDVAAVQTLNISLEVGQITQSVVVNGAVQQVNTEDATLSGVVQESQIQNLPLNGRDVFTLEILQPGVTQALTARIANFTATDSGINWAEGKYSFNTAGHPVTANDYTLDGVANNSPIYGGKPGATPSVDNVQEFRIQENNFSTEYGRNSGAVINVVTKSGTNQLHGTAYWYLRNNIFDARTVFDPSQIAPLRQAQPGFTTGGPIVKNRTFFFFGFEELHQFKGSSQIGTFETPQFRALVHSLSPGSGPDKLLQTFPGPPIISGTERDIGSPSTAYATPGPKDGIPDIGQARYVTNSLITGQQYNLRLDQHISSKNQLFGRFTWGPANTSPVDARSPLLGVHETGFQGQGVFSDTHVFSQNKVNEFRWGYTRNRITDSIARFDVPNVTISANIGGDSIGGFANVGVPSYNIGEEYSLNDIFSWNVGRHALKFGYEHHWDQDNGNRFTTTNGIMTYRGLMDFAANLADTSSVRINPAQVGGTPQIVGTPDDYRQQDNGVFVQDTWKVMRHLVLTAGLRWDRYGKATERRGRIGAEVLGSGSDIFQQTMNATVQRVPYVYSPGNQWAPRFGFAWDVTGDGKTSVRGGYGVAYDRLQFLAFRGGIRFNPPDSATLSLSTRQLATPLGLTQTQLATLLGGTLTLPYSLPPGTTSKGFNAAGGPVLGFAVNGTAITLSAPVGINSQQFQFTPPYSQNWFLSVQRELPSKVLLEVAYIGNVGRHEPIGVGLNYNRFNGDVFGAPNPYTGANAGDTGVNLLNPNFAGLTLVTYDQNSSYNGGYVSVSKRFSRGFSFQSSYTYGHAIDSTPAGRNDQATPDPHILSLQRGTAGYDVTRRWVSNFVYELPFLKAQNGIAGAALGGWQLQGIIQMQSGTPYTVVTTNANYDFNGDGSSGDRPDAPAAGASPYNGVGRQQYLNGVFGPSTPIGANSLNLPTTLTLAQSHFFPAGFQPANACYAAGKTGAVRQLAGRPCFAEGNLGRNTFRGPGYQDVDASLFKNFRLPWFGSEPAKLQFRVEVFNLLNRVNLQQVDNSLDSATFGRATSAFDAREFQFALKLVF
ncbi:MAG: TonB-dependent receptor domain-containing protein [Bryobacteraceae bacterium]